MKKPIYYLRFLVLIFLLPSLTFSQIMTEKNTLLEGINQYKPAIDQVLNKHRNPNIDNRDVNDLLMGERTDYGDGSAWRKADSVEYHYNNHSQIILEKGYTWREGNWLKSHEYSY